MNDQLGRPEEPVHTDLANTSSNKDPELEKLVSDAKQLAHAATEKQIENPPSEIHPDKVKEAYAKFVATFDLLVDREANFDPKMKGRKKSIKQTIEGYLHLGIPISRADFDLAIGHTRDLWEDTFDEVYGDSINNPRIETFFKEVNDAINELHQFVTGKKETAAAASQVKIAAPPAASRDISKLIIVEKPSSTLQMGRTRGPKSSRYKPSAPRPDAVGYKKRPKDYISDHLKKYTDIEDPFKRTDTLIADGLLVEGGVYTLPDNLPFAYEGIKGDRVRIEGSSAFKKNDKANRAAETTKDQGALEEENEEKKRREPWEHLTPKNTEIIVYRFGKQSGYCVVPFEYLFAQTPRVRRGFLPQTDKQTLETTFGIELE